MGPAEVVARWPVDDTPKGSHQAHMARTLRDYVSAIPRQVTAYQVRSEGETMGALEPWHLAIILFIVMLLFGAKRLPELARSLGSSARELRKGLKEDEEPEAKAAASQPVLQASVAPSPAASKTSAQPPTTPPAN